jgi:hypothetical protein
MKNEGPSLETLIRCLEDMPPDFLGNPVPACGSRPFTGALISDLFRQYGTALPIEKLKEYDLYDSPEDVNLSQLRSLTCWFLHHDSLKAFIEKESLIQVMDIAIPSLATEYPARKYIEDGERREELVRTILSSLSLRPAGETPAQAEDRLQSLDSGERKRMIAATRESEKRAREIREALAREAARRAADKYTRD